jgi:hypothetical protein
LTSILRRLTLRIIEVCRHGYNCMAMNRRVGRTREVI